MRHYPVSQEFVWVFDAGLFFSQWTGTYLEGCPPGPYRYGPGRNEQCDALHFWSYHWVGAHFALADGSVRLIPYGIDDATMRGLATRSGGEVVSVQF